MSVRVRFAPSPTGALHLGSARTVLFNYLFARRQGGAFVLRIEDTDRARLDESSLATILDGIRWLGLQWDEGPGVGGPHFPYFQSERLSHYHEAVERLLGEGHAYRCFCTRERLDALRQAQDKAHETPRYDRLCLHLDPAEVARRLEAGAPFTIRMRVPEGSTTVDDLLRGPVTFPNSSLDDSVLLKSDGYPTYHLAAPVDDHLMAITHVIRADEWLSSAPKQVILYGMLGWEAPAFAHVPAVQATAGRKLSKRHGAPSVLDYRTQGYLAEALVNYLAFLGWSPGTTQEYFTLDELAAAFDLARVQASPAVFDQDKLDSVNGHYIRALPPAEFARRLKPFVPHLSDGLLEHAAPLVQERIKRLGEAEQLLEFLTEAPTELPRELVPKRREAVQTALLLQEVRASFETGPVGPEQEAGLRALAEHAGWKPNELFMTLRVALTGSTVTPPLLPSAKLLGRSECLSRLDWAIGQLASWTSGDPAVV